MNAGAKDISYLKSIKYTLYNIERVKYL